MKTAFSRTPSTKRAQVVLAKPRKSVYEHYSVETKNVQSRPKQLVPSTFDNKLLLIKKDIFRFSDVEIPSDIESISMPGNYIENFNGLENLKNLVSLNLDKNPIESFAGFPNLPRLASIELKGTPISTNPNFRIALIILLGKSLQEINGEKIHASERSMAKEFPEGTDKLLRIGWQITKLPPKEEDIPKLLSDCQSWDEKAKMKAKENNEIVGKISDYQNRIISQQEKTINHLKELIENASK